MKTPIPARRRLTFAWLLAAVLLLAQGLGVAHRVLHAPGSAGGDALFGHHDRGDCQLYDQLSHGDALAVALPLLPPTLPQAVPEAAGPAGIGRVFAAAYLARAPPRG